MTQKEIIRTGKSLSPILRHEPERVGLKLDETGWARVDELLQAVNLPPLSCLLSSAFTAGRTSAWADPFPTLSAHSKV